MQSIKKALTTSRIPETVSAVAANPIHVTAPKISNAATQRGPDFGDGQQQHRFGRGPIVRQKYVKKSIAKKHLSY